MTNLDHFRTILECLRGHLNHKWPNNIEVLLVKLFPTTAATFFNCFFNFGEVVVGVVKTEIFDHFWTFLTIFGAPEGSTESNMAT